MKVNILKIGGSVVSDKISENHFNLKVTERLAKELNPVCKDSILIHGTGYIGKSPAIKYGYADTGIISKENKLLALTIRNEIRQLNQKIVGTLISASIPAIPIDILNYISDDENLSLKRNAGITIQHLLRNGLVPVLYGDLFPLDDGSFKVISSDFIVLLLAKELRPEKVIFLSNVRGIYMNFEAMEEDINQGIIRELTPELYSSLKWKENKFPDVSGGMRRKAELALEISGYCNECFIGSGYTQNLLGDLFAFEDVEGTFIRKLSKPDSLP